MLEARAQESTRTAIHRAGVAVTFRRSVGVAPNIVTLSAAVTAIVRSVVANTEETTRTGYSASHAGTITQDDRQVIVMADELTALGFPLPVVKGDKVIVTVSGDMLTVSRADSYKRDMAGAIELMATGTS